jgi:hypothetical protein
MVAQLRGRRCKAWAPVCLGHCGQLY